MYVLALNENAMNSAQQAQVVVDAIGLSAVDMWAVARSDSTQIDGNKRITVKG